ncbi:hypothetical protein FH972_022049 [Carpinus fangiana]|uniref:Lipase n=1 Tax=Carpinus fangiana TaxID=176857 RepID=A0A5N6KRM6_9ROSI|nr:hypothetical protein FH972_022049 [Carpinus fangiana]
MRSTVSSLACSLLLTATSAFSGVETALEPRQYGTMNSTTILPPSEDPWYTAPAGFEHAQPGAVLRLRAAPGNLTSITHNTTAAYHILYRTTNSRYKAAWAVTTLFVPKTPAQPRTNSTGPNTLLSYQIPYDSADVDASPSYALYASPYSDIGTALGQGWYVNVPDYEGPSASFTAGVQSGHATLDAVRAVLNTGFGLSPKTNYAMWGYSGGALASEWAAELQIQYAPELNFKGAALGGLTPNVTSVLETITGTALAGLAPAGILGLASQYPELEQYLQENLKKTGQYNITRFYAARNETLIGSIGAFANQDITEYFTNGLAALTEPIPMMVTNKDGLMGYHGVPQIPIFAYKAIKDEVSPVEDTDKLVTRYCEAGANIWYQRNTVGGHSAESTNGNARALQFLTGVLDGVYNSTGCKIENVTIAISTSPLKRSPLREDLFG